MKKTKKSGAAILMYCVIAAGAAVSAVCFAAYYGNIHKTPVMLWIGVTAFTVMYHLWMRIIMGNVTKLFGINHKWRWFREKRFEKSLYETLCVKKWKDKVLTYNPELFSIKDHSLESVADVMSKAETDHWINQLISLSTLAFALLWGQLWIFAVTAVLAMLFDAQFIVIQRYNRPRILRIIEGKKSYMPR